MAKDWTDSGTQCTSAGLVTGWELVAGESIWGERASGGLLKEREGKNNKARLDRPGLPAARGLLDA